VNTFDPRHEVEKITVFLKDTFSRTGFSSAVVGFSGGVDSATVLGLTVRALGKDAVYPVLLPYGPLGTRGVLDATEYIEALSIPPSHIVRIDIKPAVDAIVGHDLGVDRVRKGNVMARVRMVYLFDQAKKRNALVLGTENRTEHLLGYFTRFGDAASDVEPIVHLYKTEIYELARFLSVPSSIIEKTPSADLWPGQTDEGEFGFTYKDADEILSMRVDGKKSVDDIVKSGKDSGLVETIVKRMEQNEFKHKTPYILL